jgi:glutamate formiminotransferase
MALVECVPNVSEGRRLEIVDALVQAVRRVPGVRLLDHSSDRAHNRSVITMVGGSTPLRDAVLALFENAVAAIDLRTHTGEHPRLGAVDVVPFIPIEGVTMDECAALARETGAEIARRFQVPVYLYEEASADPARKQLEDIRRGQFEGLAAKMSSSRWAPDYGPSEPHPSAGASVVGARMPLIAYNINLATNRLDVAKQIAAVVRYSSGGFQYVKAMGVSIQDRGIVQVSMNLTNYEQTSLFRVCDAVVREAERHGVAVLEHEMIGLVPAAALVGASESFLRLGPVIEDQILETRLAHVSGEVGTGTGMG